MAIKVKVGVEIDSAKAKSSLDATLKALSEKKIKLNIDTSSLKQLQSTINQLSKAMANIKMPNVNAGGTKNGVQNMVAATKQVNDGLKEQAVTMSSLKQSINEEYAIRKKMVSATGEHKEELKQQLSVVEDQRKGYEQQLTSQNKLLDGSKNRLQLTDQIAKKERDLTATSVKYQDSMNKLKTNAIKNMNTDGLSTKQIDEYKSKLEGINTVSMDQVKQEIRDIGKEMDNQRGKAMEFGQNLESIGDGMASAGKSILKAFAVPTAGLVASVKTFADFEYQMSTVQAVSSATEEQMQQLTTMAKQMGIETSFSARIWHTN